MAATRATRARDYETANAQDEIACGLDYRFSCARLAYNLRLGRGAEADFERARELSEPACEGESAVACTTLGELHHFGLGVAVNHETAAQFYEQACSEISFDGDGCNNLALLFLDGLGVEKSADRAKELFDRASLYGRSSAAIFNRCLMEQEERGFTTDPLEACQPFRGGCNANPARCNLPE